MRPEPILLPLERLEQRLQADLTQALEGAEVRLQVPNASWLAVTLTGALAAAQSLGERAVRADLELKAEGADIYRAELARYAREQGADLARKLTDQQRERVRAILADAATTGAGPAAIKARVLAAINGIPAARTRAELIARTELHNAAMAAQDATARHWVRQGADLVKVWTAVMDRRTRNAHRLANGQRRELDEDFVVGNTRMSRPGDPRGGAANVIQCRCVARYLPRSFVERDRAMRANAIAKQTTTPGKDGPGRIDQIGVDVDRELAEAVIAEALKISPRGLIVPHRTGPDGSRTAPALPDLAALGYATKPPPTEDDATLIEPR